MALVGVIVIVSLMVVVVVALMVGHLFDVSRHV